MQSNIYLRILVGLHVMVISTDGLQQIFRLKNQYLNKRLLGYKLFEKNVSGHHACAYECMVLGACKSINYIGSDKTCDFNSKGSESVDASEFVESKRTIFSDISDWPKSIASGCAFHVCGPKQRCFPLGDNAHQCINITCDEPQNSQYGVVQPGSNVVDSDRSYLFACPDGMFLKGDTKINCLLNGDWTILEATCVVSTIGSTCNSSIDCKETGAECLVGKCFCGRLYRYDANTKDCVKVCSATKDTFTVYEKTRIGAYNDLGRVKEITITECREQCAGNDDCLSFEYYEEEGICNWSSVTMEMIEDAFPEIIKPDPKDLYSRDCS